jgi:hypothetical protein
VDDEGVHAAGVVAEARDAVAALLGGAELVLEEGVVLGADDGEVEGHGEAGDMVAILIIQIDLGCLHIWSSKRPKAEKFGVEFGEVPCLLHTVGGDMLYLGCTHLHHFIISNSHGYPSG